MLILSRRVGEAVQIGDNITVRVLGVKGGQVRIGFDVPKDVNVMRTELLNLGASTHSIVRPKKDQA